MSNMKLDIIKLELKNLEVCISKLENLSLKQVSNDYYNNLKNLNITSQIPILITSMIMLTGHLEKLADLNYLKQQILNPGEDKEKIKKDVWDNIQKQNTDKEVFLKRADDLLRQIKKQDKELEVGLNILKLNFIANSWAIYESTCKDIWRILVNENPQLFVHSVLEYIRNNQNAQDSLTSKSISIGFLAKYNFDISKNLGDILVSKFDFSGNSGIFKAFSKLLIKNKINSNFLVNNNLSELEIARHVIVHRAGIIDEEYINRTKRINVKIGERLEYSTTVGKRLSQSSVNSVIKLINIIGKLPLKKIFT